MQPLINSYLRFAKLANVFFRDSHFILNPNQRALLDAIALAWHQGQPMSVREAISLKTRFSGNASQTAYYFKV